MSQKKRKILVVSRNPTLAKIRKTVCEGAGFTVIAATNDSAVEPACRKGIEFVLVGYSVAPSDKRRVWAKSRQYSDVPILELQRSGNPELIERNLFADESKRAYDCLIVVQELSFGAECRPALRHEVQREQAKKMRATAKKMRARPEKMRHK